jgi:hypothetical protein
VGRVFGRGPFLPVFRLVASILLERYAESNCPSRLVGKLHPRAFPQKSSSFLEVREDRLVSSSDVKRNCEGLASGFLPYFPRVLVVPQRDEPRVPQMILWRPFRELELPNQLRLEPQCRMPDYAASDFASIVITAFSVILLGIIRLSMRQRNRARLLTSVDAARPQRIYRP